MMMMTMMIISADKGHFGILTSDPGDPLAGPP